MRGLISIRLPEKMQKELESISKIERKSKSEIIREALSQYLAIKKFQQLRKKVLPFAEAEGLLTDEDIFRSIS
ncbi:ribbon-helix-helix protein, CopG family [Thermosulfurimonas sp.]|uniref:CopG family ribbon-helix-helix protein n=1 Tax=Thermosulfurimonas sp. TaxID=2080236 RepID=UPI0025CE64EF|nr:ribbon-helix-helix protein, CopG family [Thermosulfurimonas sp.]